MVKFSPKPKQELELQAQIASFACAKMGDYSNFEYMMRSACALAKEGMGDVTRVLSSETFCKDFRTTKNPYGAVPAGTVIQVATSQDYIQYLRDVGGTSYSKIAERIIILKRYQEFQPLVEKLKEELGDLDDKLQHPQFLGKGSNASVFAVSYEGEQYAVRIPNSYKVNPASVDFHLSGGCLSVDMPRMEQIVAASYQDGVTVAKLMSGREMGNLGVADVLSMTNQQLSDLLEIVIEANRRGIELDPKPSNFFYDPKDGFGIVDFTSSKRLCKNSMDQECSSVVGWLSTVISNAGFYGKPYNDQKLPADYQAEAEQSSANLEVLFRLKELVIKRFDGDPSLEKIKQNFNRCITHCESKIKDYTNPIWVEAAIAERINQLERQGTQKAVRDESDLIV